MLHGGRVAAAIRSDASFGFDEYGNKPSEKQLQYAQQLAQRISEPVPPDAFEDKSSCSAFIDRALAKSAPSERQIQFAEALAAAKGLALPLEARSSAKGCSEFIDAHQQVSSYGSAGYSESGGRPPTDKQVLFAASLARDSGLGLTYEMLADRTQLSQFIDERLRERDGVTATRPPAEGTMFPNVAAGVAAGDLDTDVPLYTDGTMPGRMSGDDVLEMNDLGGTDDVLSGSSAAASGQDAGDDDDLFRPKAEEPNEEPSYFKEGQIPF